MAPSLRPPERAPAAGATGRAFVRRWGISLASLASGLLTLFFFRRGVPHVGWIVGYVVVLWLLFLEGRVISTVRLPTPVRGRPGGFRTYSRKSDFPPDAHGRWTVDVVTASGQLIGRLRFRVDA